MKSKGAQRQAKYRNTQERFEIVVSPGTRDKLRALARTDAKSQRETFEALLRAERLETYLGGASIRRLVCLARRDGRQPKAYLAGLLRRLTDEAASAAAGPVIDLTPNSVTVEATDLAGMPGDGPAQT